MSKICCNVDIWISFFLFDAAELSLSYKGGGHFCGSAMLGGGRVQSKYCDVSTGALLSLSQYTMLDRAKSAPGRCQLSTSRVMSVSLAWTP